MKTKVTCFAFDVLHTRCIARNYVAITALAAALPRRKVTFFGRRTSGPCSGREEGPQGRNGSITPLLCVNVEP